MFQDELGSKTAKELGGRDVVLITLNRPLIYIQPIAVDRAILVWLNYRNAYEYWTEQRASLNKEVLTATQQVGRSILANLTTLLKSDISTEILKMDYWSGNGKDA